MRVERLDELPRLDLVPIDLAAWPERRFLVLRWRRPGNDAGVPQPVLSIGRYTLHAVAFASEGADMFSTFGGRGRVEATFTATPVVGTAYCTGGVNSSGTAATLRGEGTPLVADMDLRLVAEGVVPSTFGLFFFGPSRTLQPLGAGTLCVGGTLRRLHAPALTDVLGRYDHPVDLSSSSPYSALLAPGSTWNFQFWYRDALVPEGSNASDALEVTLY